MDDEKSGGPCCPSCGNREIERFHVDTLDREWSRHSVAVSGDGRLDVGEHLKSLEVVGEADRRFVCGACAAEFRSEESLRAPQRLEGGVGRLAAPDGTPIAARVSRGLPSFAIAGAGDRATRESRERISAAIVNSGAVFPLRRIEIGGRARPGEHDVAIAAAILLASGQAAPESLAGVRLGGELRLDGTIGAGAAASLAELIGEGDGSEGSAFAVDLPDPGDPHGAWVRHARAEGYAEAVEIARRDFGADGLGRIGLVSEIPREEPGRG